MTTPCRLHRLWFVMALLVGGAAFFLPRAVVPATAATVEGWDSKAIAKALAGASPGETVSLPRGRYTISEPIRPKSGVRLIGAGQNQTVVRYAADKPGVMILLRQCEDVEIAHLTLDAENSPQVTQGISGSDSRCLRIHHLTLRNLANGQGYGPHGILFSGVNPTRAGGVTDSEIGDCLMENIAPGAAFGGAIRLSWGSSRNRVVRNVIRNTGRGGIFADNGSTDLWIQQNRISGSGGEGLGIEVWGRCDRSVIEDNVIDHWLSIGGSDLCAVRRNVISDKSGRFKACGIEGIGSDCVYTDNVVDDGQAIGISVSATCPKDRAYWGYNTIRNCIQWGAQLQGEANGMARHYFYRCTFTDTSRDRGRPPYPADAGTGFRVHQNVKDLVLEECELRGNARHGLQLGTDVDRLSFVRCRLLDNRSDAVVGPGEYHPSPSGPRGYSHLEWTDCNVQGNGTNRWPPAKAYPSPPPVAGIESPAAVVAGKPVPFSSTSRAASGSLASLLWDFGEGPPSTEPKVSHTYAKSGSYRVTLVVWDQAGRGARSEKQIRVGELSSREEKGLELLCRTTKDRFPD